MDREAIDKEPFIADGGFNRLNKVFGGELESVLSGIKRRNVEGGMRQLVVNACV